QALMTGPNQQAIDAEPGRIAERLQLGRCFFEFHGNMNGVRGARRQVLFLETWKEPQVESLWRPSAFLSATETSRRPLAQGSAEGRPRIAPYRNVSPTAASGLCDRNCSRDANSPYRRLACR